MDFRTPTGIAGGVVSWSTTSRICYQDAPAEALGDGQVVLIRDLGLKSSTTTVLASHVAALLEGETANGKDDNGNGLVDEPGLSFVLSGDQLTIRMSFADQDADAQAFWVTAQTQVRLRN